MDVSSLAGRMFSWLAAVGEGKAHLRCCRKVFLQPLLSQILADEKRKHMLRVKW